VTPSDEAELREQFSQRTSFPVGEALFEYVRITPNAPSEGTPILFAPGFAETLDTLEEISIAIAMEGRSVVALQSLRKMPDFVGMSPLSPAASAVMATIESIDAPVVDAIAESAGAAAVLIAASQFPERFRRVILLNPAGFQGGENLDKVLERFNAHILRTTKDAIENPSERSLLQRYLWEGPKWIAKNPKGALEDAVAISHMDLRPLLEEAQEAGVRIAILQGAEDLLMPAEVSKRSLEGSDDATIVTVPGGHAMHHAKPAEFAHILVNLLKTLAEKGARSERPSL